MPSTNKTPNLQLNQWVGNDTPKWADRNADNAKIDVAIGNLADLQTTEKGNLVEAINRAALTGPGSHAPYILENGNWAEWDAINELYVDSGVKAQGPAGILLTDEEPTGEDRPILVDESADSPVNLYTAGEVDHLLSPTLSLIEKIIIGYSVTTDTAFQAETTYYKNTGTAILPVYTALVAGTDYTVGDSIATFGQTVYIYSDAGVLSVTRTTKPDGSPYNFIWCGERLFCPGATVSINMNIYGYYGSTKLTATYLSGIVSTGGPRYGFFEIFQNMGYWDSSASGGVGGASYVVTTYYSSAWNLKYQNSIAQYPVMNKIVVGTNSSGVMPSGLEIYIYGVEKA